MSPVAELLLVRDDGNPQTGLSFTLLEPEVGLRPLISLALLLSLACASSGRDFNEDAVPLIQPGETTRERIQELFGKPTSVRSYGGGDFVWTYDHRKTSSKGTGTVTKLVRFVGSLLGMRTYMPPVDYESSNTTRHSLTVEFYADGIVRDYTYDRSESPSQSIY